MGKMAGKSSNWLGLAAIVFIAVIGALYVTGNFNLPMQVVQTGQTGTGAGTTIPTTLPTCPDTMQTTLTINWQNVKDTTQSDTFDITAYLYKVNGNDVVYDSSITDTTSGSKTLDCGATYYICPVSADGYGGDNSKIYNIVSGNAQIVSYNGAQCVKITTKGASMSLTVGGSRHGALEFRVFDLLNNDYVYASAASSALTYQTGDTTYKTTTSNSSANAVGTAGELHYKVEFRANATNHDWADQGFYILVDASTTKWNIPTVVLDNIELTDVKGSLTTEEAAAYSDYEYVYRVDKEVVNKLHYLDFYIKALSGVNPGASDDVKIKFAPIGQYLSVDGITVKKGAIKDDSSKTAVFTATELTFDVS